MFMPMLAGLFSQTSVGAVLAFHALAPDPDTYEMKGVLVGTGGLTTTHTATIYAPDADGIYRPFAANEPVWEGGRVVQNWAPYANDLESSTGPGNVLKWSFSNADVSGNTVSFNALYSSMGHRPDAYNNRPAGEIWILSAKVTHVSGNPRLYFGITGTSKSPTGTYYDFDPGETAIISITAVCSGIPIEAMFQNRQTTDLPCVFTIEEIMLEKVDGQATQIRSEFVNTGARSVAGVPLASAAFANENGNVFTAGGGSSGVGVVTEAVGDPLPEMPYLKYQPAATNSCLRSNDLTTTWASVGVDSRTFDQTGLYGAANTASRLYEATASSSVYVWQEIAIPNDSDTHTFVAWVKKDSVGVSDRRFAVEFKASGGTQAYYRVGLDTSNGDIAAIFGSGSVEVVSDGDWWKLLISITNNSTGNTTLRAQIYPNYSGSSAAEVIVGNVEFHLDKTIAEVRGLGPIFTTSAAVSVDATEYSVESVDYGYNQDSAYYAELDLDFEPGTSHTIFGNNSTDHALGGGATNLNIKYGGNSSVTVSYPFTGKLGTVHMVGDTSGLVANVDGTWSATPGNSDGNMQTVNTIFDSGDASASQGGKRIRNLRRYDIASYQEGKDIIDELMGV